MSDSSKTITIIAGIIVIPVIITFYMLKLMFKIVQRILEGFMCFALGFLGGTARGIKKRSPK